MRITDQHIIAPDLPADAVWINHEPAKIDDLLREGPVLVEFWDFARVNSLRTLPYMEEWHKRYSLHGLTVIGVLSPGYTFSADEEIARAAVERLGIERPVILDPAFALWRDYGNQGWPGRYLWGKNGYLGYFHYGEGDYLEAELAIQDALTAHGVAADFPEPMTPLRPEDVPGAEFPPQTADISLPPELGRLQTSGEWRESADWIQSGAAGDTATAKCNAGGAFAILSGKGAAYPGCHELQIVDGGATVTATEPGLRVHGFQFTPDVSAAAGS